MLVDYVRVYKLATPRMISSGTIPAI